MITKPLARRVAICLALGAAINILVAWGCVLWSPASAGPLPPLSTSLAVDRREPERAEEAWGPAESSRVFAGFGYTELDQLWVLRKAADGSFGPMGREEFAELRRQNNLAGIPPRPIKLRIVTLRRGAAGWPWPALQWRTSGSKPLPPLADATLSGRLREPLLSTNVLRGYLGIHTDRSIPLWPAWPGTVLNTLLFAVLVGIAARGIAQLRRHLRRRRGLCPHCAYPIGISPVCAECGAALPLTPSTRPTDAERAQCAPEPPS